MAFGDEPLVVAHEARHCLMQSSGDIVVSGQYFIHRLSGVLTRQLLDKPTIYLSALLSRAFRRQYARISHCPSSSLLCLPLPLLLAFLHAPHQSG